MIPLSSGDSVFDSTNLRTLVHTPAGEVRESLHGRQSVDGTLLDEAPLVTQLRLLSQVAQAAAGNLDLGRILQVALRELDRHLPLHVLAVWLFADDDPGQPDDPTATLPPATLPKAVVLAEASPGAPDLGLRPDLRLALEQTSFADCLGAGQALYADLTRDAKTTPGSLNWMLALRGVRMYFAVPLRAGDRTVGILQSICSRPTGFKNEQIQLIYLTADLLGPAISNYQLFAKLHRAYEDLGHTHHQLLQAEKMRALGELAGGMVHEFNNSLCGVLGFLELTLWDQALSAISRGYLESARTCALDAAQTVRRVQEFARQRPNDAPAQVLDVNDLVRQTIELVRHKWESLAGVRGTPIAIALQTEAKVPICGQPTEMREVLTNLVFNAVDAMPQGGTLTVRTWNTDTDVFLAVRDTGLGIRDEDRPRLFEPFFTTKEERGNGLGLSVTFALVRRHGGEIAVESQVGQGSMFTIRLPAAVVPLGVRTAATSASDQESSGVSLRVLVVEDEESIRRFLAACLKRLGHRPRLACDVPEARAALEEECFDVVFTDLGLAGASGEEVVQEVVRRVPGTPVVLLTGWADQLQAEATSIEGVTRLLGKPITIDTLRTTLAEIVSASGAEPAASTTG